MLLRIDDDMMRWSAWNMPAQKQACHPLLAEADAMLSIHRRAMTDKERATVSGWAETHARRPRPTLRRRFFENVIYIGFGFGLVLAVTALVSIRWSGQSWSMAIFGAAAAIALLVLYVLFRSRTAGEKRACDREAAAYDRWTEQLGRQLESGEVEVVEFEADMVWYVIGGPPVYLFRVEPTKFALVELHDDWDIMDFADGSTMASQIKLEYYPQLRMLMSACASGPKLASQQRRMDLKSLIGVTDLGPLPYRILTVDEIPSDHLRHDLLEGAT